MLFAIGKANRDFGGNGKTMNKLMDKTMNANSEKTWIEGPSRFGKAKLNIHAKDASAVMDAWNRVDSRLTGSDITDALVESLAGTVDQRTIYAIRAQLTPTTNSLLLKWARNGDARVVLTFAGQAQSYFDDLERLYEIPNAKRLINSCATALKMCRHSCGFRGIASVWI